MADRAITVLIIVLCLAGVLVSSLAIGEHYNTEGSPCQINQRWDCGVVNHSPWAALPGVWKYKEIPVALIGALGYALLGALAGRARWLAFIGALIGLGFALRLTYIEWRVLMVWCLYCVSSQIIIALVVVASLGSLLLARHAESAPAPAARTTTLGL